MSDRNCARRPNTFFLSSTDKKKGKKIKTRATINRRNNEKKKAAKQKKNGDVIGAPRYGADQSVTVASKLSRPSAGKRKSSRPHKEPHCFFFYYSNLIAAFITPTKTKEKRIKREKKNTQPTGAVDRSIQRFTSLAAGHSLRPKLENKNLKKKDAFFWNRWSGNQLGPTLLSLCWLH